MATTPTGREAKAGYYMARFLYRAVALREPLRIDLLARTHGSLRQMTEYGTNLNLDACLIAGGTKEYFVNQNQNDQKQGQQNQGNPGQQQGGQQGGQQGNPGQQTQKPGQGGQQGGQGGQQGGQGGQGGQNR